MLLIVETIIFLTICLSLEIAKGNEEKFKKMKDIYTKLREEHVHLLKEVSLSLPTSLSLSLPPSLTPNHSSIHSSVTVRARAGVAMPRILPTLRGLHPWALRLSSSTDHPLLVSASIPTHSNSDMPTARENYTRRGIRVTCSLQNCTQGDIYTDRHTQTQRVRLQWRVT